MRKWIQLFVIGHAKWFSEQKQVAYINSEASKHKFHDEEIKRFPSKKNIDVTSDEHHRINLLGFIGDAINIAVIYYLPQQHDDCE